jgi:DNA polymerase III, gamma/tau subunits
MFSFDEVVGNQSIVSNLKLSVQKNRIFHSYIFYAQEGSQKLFIAKCFAKLIQCENKNSCGKCYSCKSFDFDNNPDVIYVLPSKTKNLGVDDIREQVKSQVDIKPYACKYKIFIIEHADKMTPQAQNALLKILEEPPEFIIFILLGENINNFLPTIISRCSIIKIAPVAINLIQSNLQKQNIDEKHAEIYALYSQGNIGRALKFASDENFNKIRNNVLDIIKKLQDSDVAQALSFVSEFEKFKDDFQLVLDIIYLWYADLIVYSATGDTSFIYNADMKDEIIKQAMNYDDLYGKIKAVEQAKKYLHYNTNFKMTLNVMLLEMCGR